MVATSKRAPIHALLVDEQGNAVNIGGDPKPGSITTEMFAPDAKAPLAGAADTANGVTWANVSGKPSTFPPATHTHTIAQVTGLQTALDTKLTASKAAAVADSSGVADVAALETKVNELLAALRTAGIMNS